MNKWEQIVRNLNGDLIGLFYKTFENENFHVCSGCGISYPRHPLFFKKVKYGNGLDSKCKDCRTLPFITKSTHIIFKDDIDKSEKICSQCYKILPNDSIHFTKEHSKCKKCLGKEYGLDQSSFNSELSKINKKKCKYCLEIKDVSEFKYHNSKKNMRVSYCISCEEIYKQEKRRYDKLYYVENKENKKKYYIRWKENGGNLIRQVNEQNRITKKKSLLSDLTTEQWELILDYFDHKCAYCGINEEDHRLKYHQSLHQDHLIPLSKNGVFSDFNIIPACLICNDSKNNMDLEDFLNHSDKFNLERYINILDFILQC